jgi:hypothetical protein
MQKVSNNLGWGWQNVIFRWIMEIWEWLKGWANYFSPRRTQSSQRFLKDFSVFSVNSVVKLFGEPTQLSTLGNLLPRLWAETVLD